MKKIFGIIVVLLCVSSVWSADGQKWLQRARNGELNAMYQTALRYDYGTDGLPKDKEKALFWAEKGGNLGDVRCMTLAALIYSDAKKNKFESKSYHWNAKAGESGSLDGALGARNDALAIKRECSNDDERRRALELQIYWNEKILSYPEIRNKENVDAYNQSLSLRDRLNKELTELTPAQDAVATESEGNGTDTTSAAPVDPGKVYNVSETAPEFPGGLAAMYSWLGKNIIYPENAAARDVQGRVSVRFVVAADGSISNAQVVRSVDADLDKEALRVVSAMPKWTPGTMGGKPVAVYYTLPITFKLHR